MTTTEKREAEKSTARTALDRRAFLATSAAAATTILISGGAIIKPSEAWGYEVKALRPETMRTLVQLARDIYPHDRLADRFYAVAVKTYDEQAVGDATLKTLVEDGVANLDALARSKHGVGYIDVGWEADRARLLREISEGPFFQTVRSGLVTGLYNNKEIWPLFGYEGESASRGGYISRGFDDLDWL